MAADRQQAPARHHWIPSAANTCTHDRPNPHAARTGPFIDPRRAEPARHSARPRPGHLRPGDRRARAPILPRYQHEHLGASAEYLGPTLILHRGDTARIRIHNELAEMTSMHWHGMHVPGEMDGGPRRIIDPGDSFMAEFVVKTPAATYWYHPHPHELTAEQANFGIAGFIVVRDEEEEQLALPRDYGVDDFPVVIQDRKFLPSGDFAFYPFGDSVLVNGTPNAYLECPAQVVRLRLLNGSNAASIRWASTTARTCT
ncbi:MAG: multicopper oxidase domain-containing protein [Flavobacteriales bacterium]|nr:multicopper oxidase domain-containing protein [Flavobacteriales bacterium]